MVLNIYALIYPLLHAETSTENQVLDTSLLKTTLPMGMTPIESTTTVPYTTEIMGSQINTEDIPSGNLDQNSSIISDTLCGDGR